MQSPRLEELAFDFVGEVEFAEGAGIPSVKLVKTPYDFMEAVADAFDSPELSVVVAKVEAVGYVGFLAAVAAPRFLDTSAGATDNGIKQSLGVVRDAIELYAAENGGALPGADGNCNCNVCPFMAKNTMEKLYLCLDRMEPQIDLPPIPQPAPTPN